MEGPGEEPALPTRTAEEVAARLREDKEDLAPDAMQQEIRERGRWVAT